MIPRMLQLTVVAAIATFLPSGAGAADPPGALAAPECTCRAGGADWAQGHELCIGEQMVVCVMEQNVTSWKRTGRSCPTSMAPMTPRQAWKSRREG